MKILIHEDLIEEFPESVQIRRKLRWNYVSEAPIESAKISVFPFDEKENLCYSFNFKLMNF
ncbi:hypothetical protein COW36_10415 [bacterium (Candidatus Blackallbacteria) CG17_big_fil_post_rev_8_21_14_2_50_48_46]|uniref:Uncharacterized protein n=1 Tax=bacterium (Candidatus Blackallbacteria) CG17_big_fil_post_rev_8_21_14_2_50_48_46 TaxID=2014261 RepID=A0A2M7G623_9BACT|nr:MAG: hypothetical protein COW64_20190 [bacterium (Candidatus Blackallbacteria) CG18_big_fil_WC_8_21_14_2_50_49_26]PIW17045.1 MAG: hypothetical protein COW36_10415 [bacterium (Candidatus Blackallbacteria) CG17_big_fil_post_rev_8_21_14_2_50_48_46]PIW47720.1 MAG: hypothetical protein COW20_11805 [bacterium (Candidatus Blackallbacteria) CG13_big_fil_rev_8_21_14_2_50_49_14]